jgi:DNA polymerase (family 10)
MLVGLVGTNGVPVDEEPRESTAHRRRSRPARGQRGTGIGRASPRRMTPVVARPWTNAELARRLIEFAQMLRAKGENPYKVRAYRRAAETVANQADSVDRMVRTGDDLTRLPGIGKGIAAALHELVFSGQIGQLALLLTDAPPEMGALNEYPRLDPRRVARVYRKLGISSVGELREKFAAGAIREVFGPRMEDHFRHAFQDTMQILLHDADALAQRIQRFLAAQAGVRRLEIAGEVRRRVEVVGEIGFLVESEDFDAVVARARTFGGGLELIDRAAGDATFQLPGSGLLTLHRGTAATWGRELIVATGSAAHLEELEARARWRKPKGPQSGEHDVYTGLGLDWIPPELREGHGEVKLAATGKLPDLVTLADIRGELHAHTTSSDGAHSIEEMAAAAKARGYGYLGITDHSQSLKIARGVSIDALWGQIRRIDRLNARLSGIRILKSAEVDILADGTLDYPDDLLAELDYTICSIHSRFALNREQQTTRILRAMDHPAFTILGHATGRLLLKRSGYDLDLARIIRHAQAAGVFFEINASPDRLDLSAENVRLVTQAGIRIAICTDAHHIRELDYLACGIDVARRGGVAKSAVLNTLSWAEFRRAIRRAR